MISRVVQAPPHLFTVDVEEYYHASALAPYLPREKWPALSRRVDVGMDLLLDLLDRHGATATFFVLGPVAQSNPALIRRMVAAGHEVASHGWSHRSLPELTESQFRDEVVRSKGVLSELAGRDVIGFRAPNFSIRRSCEWAFDVLLEAGYQYDASVFPSRGSGLDFPGDDIHVVRRPDGDLLEVPMSYAAFGSIKVPAAGGAWFRLLPYWLSDRALKQARKRGQPGVFYIHPWELDTEQPRVDTNVKTRLRHYGGLGRVEGRLARLLSEHRFTSIEQCLAESHALPA